MVYSISCITFVGAAAVDRRFGIQYLATDASMASTQDREWNEEPGHQPNIELRRISNWEK
jgi:hypothetical protein